MASARARVHRAVRMAWIAKRYLDLAEELVEERERRTSRMLRSARRSG